MRLEKIKTTFKKDKSSFVVSHIGRLYPFRMPCWLAELLAQVAAEWNEKTPILFQFVGTVVDPSVLEQAFTKFNVSNKLQFVGDVSIDKALEETVRADVLMLLQLNTDVQIPAKIFEYAFSSSPVMCFADIDSEPDQLIKNYNLGMPFYESATKEQVLKWLTTIYNNTILPQNLSSSFLSNFDGDKLSLQLEHKLLQFKSKTE
jgi:glycosyltransferase involved in cell wall biosynthesis